MKRTRVLALYVLVAALAQLGLYATWAVTGGENLFYFDPRLGISFLAYEFWAAASEPPLVAWIAGVATLVAATALFVSPRVLWLYLLTETVLALPTLAFFGIVVTSGLSAGHGFSISD